MNGDVRRYRVWTTDFGHHPEFTIEVEARSHGEAKALVWRKSIREPMPQISYIHMRACLAEEAGE